MQQHSKKLCEVCMKLCVLISKKCAWCLFTITCSIHLVLYIQIISRLNYAPPHSYFFSHLSNKGVDPKVLYLGKVNYMAQYFSDCTNTHTVIV